MDHALLSRHSLFYTIDLWNSRWWSKRTCLDHIRKRHRLCHSISWNITARRNIANAIMHQVKRGRACDEAAISACCRSALLLCHVNDVVRGNIDTLDRTCDDTRTNCAGRVFALVDIDTNAVDVMLGSGIEDTNTTKASDLEEDIGLIIAKLLVSDSTALGGILEVTRVADHYLNARVDFLSAILVPSDVANDRWDGKATDSADGVVTEQLRRLGFAISLHLTSNCANKAARFLLFKEERRHVGEIDTSPSFVRGVCSTAVNQGELLVGERLGNRVHRVLHQEPYADDHICLLCLCGDVFGVFSVADCLRLNDQVRETVLGSSLLVACMGKLVKAAVIQAANVGHYSRRHGGFGGGRSGSSAPGCCCSAAAGCKQHGK